MLQELAPSWLGYQKKRFFYTSGGGGKPETNIRGMNKGRVNELSPKSVMLTSSLGFPGLINLIKKGSIRLSKNIACLSTGIITSYTFYMFDVEKLKKVVYLLLFLYLVIKNLPYLLDIFGVESIQFSSNDEN